MRTHDIIRLIAFAICTAMMLSSCHSTRRTARGDQSIINNNAPSTAIQLPNKGTLERSLIDYAISWTGTPYRYGGNDRNGVDCSGFTCNVFDHVAKIKLPRSSTEQASFCRKIDRRELHPGDLIFFVSSAGGSRINHVALYIGENQIVHATTSRGVVISDLNEKYWQRHYHHCGRVSAAFP